MDIHKIMDKEKEGHYLVFTRPDIEYVNPILHHREIYIKKSIIIEGELLKALGLPIRSMKTALLRSAIQDWTKYRDKIFKTKIPSNLKEILSTKKKKEQKRLLKDLSITSDQFLALIMYAWRYHGFTFSKYRSDNYPKGVDESQFPTLINTEGEKVTKIGETTLSDGQLKQAIQQRKVVVATFLDRKDEWHCLFTTFHSLKGEESWQKGQPHYHYISDKFGISRDKVIKELKSPNYKLPSLPHINLTDYGKQP